MAHHDFTTPVGEAAIRGLRVNDTVTLNGTLYGIRDATQIHMFDRGRKTRFDLAGHAVIHTAPNVKKVEPSPEHPAGYAPVCIGTTTSARMERFTRPLMSEYGVRMIIGKGGMLADSLAAFAELGGVYLAIVGGAAALETTWIEQNRGRGPGRPQPRESVALPRPGIRAAAGRDGQPWRQPLHRAEAGRGGAPRGSAREPGHQIGSAIAALSLRPSST